MNKPLASMTGYARASGETEGLNFAVELKSVNARGLDIRLRLPAGFDALEPRLRALISNGLNRGAVNGTVTLDNRESRTRLSLNREALDQVLAAMDGLAGRVSAENPRLDGILGLKGVLEAEDVPFSPEIEERLFVALEATAQTCLDNLVMARREEGARLGAMLTAHIDEIERLTQAAEAHPSRDRQVIVERLREQVGELIEANEGNLSEDRLHQEALLLATRADIREELDRLKAHVEAARKLIGDGGPAGRRLDFLAQEFNREANTLCSKSNAVELTAIGLDLKAAIDQLREQIQNLE